MTSIRILLLFAALASASRLAAQRVVLTDFAAHKSGDDWAPAFRAAFAEGDFVYVPAGEYRCSDIPVPGGKTVAGEGAATRFIPLGEVLFRVEGSAGEEFFIREDMADFSQTVPLAAPGEFSPGDDLLLIGQRNSLMREDCGPEWTLGRTYKKTCPFGEFLTVAAVQDDILTTTAPTIFPFYCKDASRETIPEEYTVKRRGTTAQRLDMVKRSHLRSFTVVNTDTCRHAVLFRYAEQCSAQQITVEIPAVRKTYCAFALNWCKFVRCKECTTTFSPALADSLRVLTRDGYAAYTRYNLFRATSSLGCGFEACSSDFSTHAFNISSGNGSIPCVGCYVRNCRADNALWAGVIVQQACCNTLLEGNVVTASAQGVVSGGRNTVIRNNEVRCGLPLDTNYYYAHVKRGGTSGVGVFEGYAVGSVIENNTVEGASTGILVIDGYEERNIFTEGDILIRGNRVRECVNGFFIYKSKYNKEPSDLNITLEDNSFIRQSGPTAQVAGQAVSTYGIRLYPRTCGVTLRGNAVSGYKYGVFISSPADRIAVAGNLFNGTTYGIAVKRNKDPKTGIVRENNTFVKVGTHEREL